MTSRCLFFAASLATALVPASAIAGRLNAHLFVVQDTVHVRFDAAGGSTIERTEIVKAMDAAGASILSRLTIPFNDATQHVTVDGASVVFPDESMHLVPPGGIVTAAWPGTKSLPGYQDAKHTDVLFGSLPSGAVVSVHYTIRTDRPWLASNPTFFAMASRRDALQDISYTITAPSALHLTIHANELTGGMVRQGATDAWTFRAHKLPPLFNVASAAERMSKSPYVVVAGASSQQAAASYIGRIHNAEHVSLELQHLADTLGGGSILPTTLMARDYAWIAKHVRLVDVPLALSGPPRHAEDILLDRYGTPEDRVILLQALLKAKSVSSDVVLVPSLPVTWSGMPAAIPTFDDRLMLTVDGGQLPMDIGSPVAALGSFDAHDRGKFGLRVAPHGGTAPLQIPLSMEDGLASSVVTNVTVQPLGALDGAATVSTFGDLAAIARGMVYSSTPLDLRHAIAPYAPATAKLSVTHVDDPAVPSSTFVLRARYSVPFYHPITGAYRMPVPRVVTGVSPMDDFARQDGAGLCQRTVRDEATTIRWAMPVDVAPPRDVSQNLAGRLGSYHATYVYDAATRSLHVERKLQLHANPVQCDPQQQRAIAGLATQVTADLDDTIEVVPLVPAVPAKRKR